MALNRKQSLASRLSALTVGACIVLSISTALAGDLTLSNSLGTSPGAVPVAPPVSQPPQSAISGEVTAAPSPSGDVVPGSINPIISLGIGDTVTIDVYGKPDLKTTTYVADDGTVLIPLAGPVKVDGLSPAEASNRIAKALKDGEFLLNPQISLTLVTSRSQLVSVLGEVAKEGRYTIEGSGTVFDVLALAGGRNKDGASVIYVLHPESDGSIKRTPINLASLSDPTIEFPTIRLHGGDTLYVPKAAKFFMQGEVLTPNQYALTADLTVAGAVALAGGVTRRGSTSRIEIKRRRPDGSYQTIHPKTTDKVVADDVIRVKESIF